MLGAFHDYLGAIAAKDYPGACSYLAARVTESLATARRQSQENVSCPQLLEALLSPQAGQIAKGQAEGKVLKLRVKGDTAFVVFHAPGARLYELTLAREGGEWKVTSLSASVLAPSG